ncbi:hypothetical protein TVAG_037970 [Trichomonas vaginalis G3]|uniref:Uncharacterized protein n=1 Tax=Trichomonas vaginalis (strain ATCC PRA-98 / G3) TaxID=412133 RepID=A2FZG2_TRIV3|nr:hypothetical protein TVAG_037970 [Trichomonas vaginalis G3]|eukprot:XP_001302644.1 hypothetical protein [Trichomonas vaginalis G3]
MEANNKAPANALAIQKPEVTEEQSSGDEEILMGGESPKTEISDRDLDPSKQTARRKGPKATPRELRLIKTNHKYLKQMEESNVALEELKLKLAEKVEEAKGKELYISQLEHKVDSYANEICDLRSRLNRVGHESDSWHERFLKADASYHELKRAIRNLATDF